MTGRTVIFDWTMQPGTGKAIELLAGQILRIEQVEGLQCVDFNCFNLHDYKEFMHCGRTRTVHGFNPTTGSFLWSAPPRERALLYILKDTVGRNDVLFPRCSAYVYESAYGFDAHTNCLDIQVIYAKGHDLKDPLISPVYGDMHGFPPTILTTGTRDLLLSNTVRVHRALRRAGVEAALQVYEGQSHAQYEFDDRPPREP